VDDEKKPPRKSGSSAEGQGLRGGVLQRRSQRIAKMEELYRKLEPELRGNKPDPEAISAALEAAQRLAAEADAEEVADAIAQDLSDNGNTEVCQVCGYRNRVGNKFCGMCGMAAGLAAVAEGNHGGDEGQQPSHQLSLSNPFANQLPTNQNAIRHMPLEHAAMSPAEMMPAAEHHPRGPEMHYYHHHYHHHYFPSGYESGMPRGAGDSARIDPPREEKLRPSAALRGDMSRAEAAVRRVTHEWVLACNTKHLDDLLDLYVADALVLRSNCPPVRGAAAVREFFFGALDAGLGEVELEPLRVEVVGDLAYEAGRCKALVPSATGKRREERGKYLWVCSRQNGGEWKLTADCWSSDLSLSMMESEVPPGAVVKTTQPRKSS
jgi:ketosteroid isomerase-like protein